jgi:hypothetical protein
LAITATVTVEPLLGRSATATGANPSFRSARAPNCATVAIRHFLKKAVVAQFDDGSGVVYLDNLAQRERKAERDRFGRVPTLNTADPTEQRHQIVPGGSTTV